MSFKPVRCEYNFILSRLGVVDNIYVCEELLAICAGKVLILLSYTNLIDGHTLVQWIIIEDEDLLLHSLIFF